MNIGSMLVFLRFLMIVPSIILLGALLDACICTTMHFFIMNSFKFILILSLEITAFTNFCKLCCCYYVIDIEVCLCPYFQSSISEHNNFDLFGYIGN